MWSSKIAIISFLIASMFFDHGGCAPHRYFGLKDIVANSDVRRPWSKSGSQKTRHVRVVSEATKPTNKIPTRGLYYPDDMFFTNWQPDEFTAENCTTNQSSGTTPTCSNSKGTLKTKNNDKSTEYQTTPGQQKTRSAVSSSSSREPTSTVAAPSPSTERQKSTSRGQSSTGRARTSSSEVRTSKSCVQKPTLAGPSLSRRQKSSTLARPSSMRRLKTSTIAVTSSRILKKMTTSSDGQSSTNRVKTSSFVTPSMSKRRKTFTFSHQSPPIGLQKSRFDGRSTPSSRSDFSVESSTSGHRKPTFSSAATTTDDQPDIDYLSYSEESRY